MSAFDYARQVGDVFSLPETCLKIKDLIDNNVSSLDEIAELIALDPALASRILKLANSALYNFPNQVDSLNKALLLLGDTQVYNLVVAYGAAEAFSKTPTQVIDLERFWEMSIHCALIAKQLGLRLGLKQSEPLYLSGLLHNIGELVVVAVKPDIAAICALYQRGTFPWVRQQELLGFSYSDCSVALLKLWKLPDNLIEPLNYLNTPQLKSGNLPVQILHLASRLALLNAAAGQFEFADLVDLPLAQSLGLSRKDLDEARAFASLEGLSILSLLNPKASMIL
ncbi:HDOD domain-containing protein [Rheinheimera sp.]|uniref:HDOD domain-containing protein n=1 Tax=Rheinheimera sp. TaxID=1869214 RepID=UPI0027BB202D|nr:HDOD domain-containing protein [Rheinheimera sp.]